MAASTANLQQTLSYRSQGSSRAPAREAGRDQYQVIDFLDSGSEKQVESRTNSGKSAMISGIGRVPGVQLWGVRTFYVLYTFLSMFREPWAIGKQATAAQLRHLF